MKIKKSKKILSKKLILLLLGLIVIACIGSYFYISNTQNKALYGSDSTTPKKDTPRSSNSDQANSSNEGSIGSGKLDSDTDQSTPSPQTNITPNTPSGIFASNHRPNLSGSPAPNSLSSTCATTPGSECRIEFKNGTTVKALPTKKADINGNIVWEWKLQDIGISEGIWEITAIASNGNLQSSSKDPMDLIVGR